MRIVYALIQDYDMEWVNDSQLSSIHSAYKIRIYLRLMFTQCL